MSYTSWQVQRSAYNATTLTWDSPTTLSEFSRPLVEVNSGEAKDSFSITFNNFNGTYNNLFQPQDKITISRVVNATTFGTADVLIVGAVKDPPYNQSASRNEVKIEGYNWSEAIFGAMVFIDPAGQTIPSVIQTALNHVKLYASNFQITWHPSNPSVTTTGAAFPAIYKQYKNVPLLKLMEELSSNIITQDGSYFWYVDLNNYLVWRPISGGNAQTFSSSTDVFKAIKSAKDVKGIINYVVVKGGRDPNGTAIQDKYIDAVSAAKNGNKYYWYSDPGIQAETLNLLDMDKSDPTKKGKHTQRFPYSYSFTCAWASQATAGTYPTVASNADYVATLRSEISYRMNQLGNQILRDYKNGKLSVDLTFEAGTKTWQLLDRVQCTIPEIFSGSKWLRVREISYSSDTDIYSLTEDVGTI